MKRKLIHCLISVAMIVGWSAPLMAEGNNCWLLGPNENDIIVTVHDADNDGNMLGLIWSGTIKQGEKKEIIAPHGNIRYSWTFTPNSAPDGDVSRWCGDGAIYQLP